MTTCLVAQRTGKDCHTCGLLTPRQKRYQAAKANGMCCRCHVTAATRGVLCPDCYKWNRQYWAKVPPRQRCHGCGGLGHTTKTCPTADARGAA